MKKLTRIGLPVWVLVLLVGLALGWPWLAQANSAAPSPSEVVQQAWQLARASGGYSYRSRVEQANFPAPTIKNAGRGSTQSRLGVEGKVDLTAQTLDFTLWQDASFNPQSGITVRVADGQTYARNGLQGWQEIDNLGDTFAPGGDPLGFLAGVQNVQFAGQEQRTFNSVTLNYTHYTFELNGPAFADHMAARLEEVHRQKYGLPVGISLDTPEAYRRMTGRGELWLNQIGLPARLEMTIEMPDQPKKGERLNSTISSDYYGYNLAALPSATPSVWQNPTGWAAAKGDGH